MKKKLIGIILIFTIVLSTFACGSPEKVPENTEAEPTEYTADELGKLIESTDELFEKESEYFTEEEINSEKGLEKYAECSDETGLPYGKEIIVRGVKKTSYGQLDIKSANDEYTIACYFPSGTNNNVGLFVEDGENIIVKGTILGFGGVYNVEFISPSELDMSYTATDINAVLSDIESEFTSINAIIYGQVSEVISLSEFKDRFNEYIDFDTRFYFDDVARIDGPDKGTIYFSYDKDTIGELAEDDQIVIQGNVYAITGFMNSGGDYNAIAGYIPTVYDCYNFSVANDSE